MISLEEALTLLRELPLGFSEDAVEPLPLEASLGRWLAEPVVAPYDQPRADLSAMDGYAFRASESAEARTDAPVDLALAGEQAAGAPVCAPLAEGTALRVFTGSLLPDGADCVLLQEDARIVSVPQGSEGRGGQVLRLTAPQKVATWVRERGRDFRAGATLLAPPRRLTPRDLGLAAAANVSRLRVRARPRVALLSCGDELVAPGTHLESAQSAEGDADGLPPHLLPASSRSALAALIASWGGHVRQGPLVPDDKDAVIAALRSALHSLPAPQLLVTTGGASVGKHDLVRPALRHLGWREHFHKVAVKPGMPVFFGEAEGPGGVAAAVLGVPGNPVSALLTSLVFLRPLLARVMGLPFPGLPFAPMPLAQELGPSGARHEFLRGRIKEDTVFPVADQDSSLLRVLSESDCLISRPPHDAYRTKGDMVSVLRLRSGDFPISL